jgi:hypothetical protein
MKRVDEKVKDIVEVRSFENVGDLDADPQATLSGYRFTDITSDLMGKWLDAVVDVRPGAGRAFALAGFRGVGKSHFLTTLEAIVSLPQVRETIEEQHVKTVAGRLPRKATSVIRVRRGSRETLLDEFKDALGNRLGEHDAGEESVTALMAAATADGAPVILVDTSMAREARVDRDDGPFLSQMAEAAKELGIFLGLALDDDISGADGANLSISGSFQIDYLDQEHLYKIVDAHIFSKRDTSLPLLQGIYRYYHDELPKFRWSEHRFVSLYPLHPAALEVAPLIRLYLHDFALLGFAAEAGVKIMGRPANSLIGIEDVFDSVESRLRNVPDLEEAFKGYDRIDHEVVAKAPVKIRLFAKLILKGLFMLSLDGGGTTADILAASMLVVDQASSGLNIAELLDSFAAAVPESILKTTSESGEARFAFKLRFADDLNAILSKNSSDVTPAEIGAILIKIANEKYSDLDASDPSAAMVSHSTFDWNGTLRHGEIHWDVFAESPAPSSTLDWSVKVGFDAPPPATEISDIPAANWLLGPLTPEEFEVLRRYHLLHNNPSVREKLKERAGPETQIHAIAAEKIWKRIFIEDAKLVIDGQEFPFDENARACHTLSQLFGLMLRPVMHYRFPSHPVFPEVLGYKEAGILTAKFFGGSAIKTPEVQRLAGIFAEPLGIAVRENDVLVPASPDVLMVLPVVQAAFAGLELIEGKVIDISEVSRRMAAPPVGCSREVQHLILSALVAARQIEFVTSNGNRINHRSLDLQILWDDVTGVSKAAAEVYSDQRLMEWARAVTVNRQLQSIENAEDRLAITDMLSGWLSNWREARFLEAFDALPDEHLTSNIWRTATALRKTFETLAGLIEQLAASTLTLERALQSVADLFNDSLEDYERKKKDLLVLRYFIDAAKKRGEILRYLSLTEATSDDTIETLRRQLLERTGPSFFTADPSLNADLEAVWQEFRLQYIHHYVTNHDAALEGTTPGQLKAMTSSDKWTAFQSFSDLATFNSRSAAEAAAIIRKIRGKACTFKTAELLEVNPFCACSFELGRFDRRRDSAARLERTMDWGLRQFAEKLNESLGELTAAIPVHNGEVLGHCLAHGFNADSLVSLTAIETVLLKNALRKLNDPGAPIRASSEELIGVPVAEWENEIENLEIFVEST